MSTVEREGASRIIEKLSERMRGARKSGGVPAGGWLRAMREARGVTQSELATKLGFKRQAWAQFEASEARGAISLASLRRAADVLECDLVYCLIPREERSQRNAVIGREEKSTTRQPPITESLRPAENLEWIETELPTELR